MNKSLSDSKQVVTKPYLIPFVLVGLLFPLWGFANDITNPMVAAFKNILLVSNFESALVQCAFYGGYCFMAIPAAIFIWRFNYKQAILMGLALYSIGCLMFIPSGKMMVFEAFLFSYFVMTCGLSFLETSANPYILSMGNEATATQRLNLAQAFNPLGSLMGMFIAKEFILARLNSTSEAGRWELAQNDPGLFTQIQQSDLNVIIGPYLMLGIVVAFVFVIFAITKLPGSRNENVDKLNLRPTLKRLFSNRLYLEGVVAQAFYVGAQIMCWTFIIHYGVNELGMTKAEAQSYNMIAMVIFVSSRFICTYLLKYINPGQLLMGLALGGGVFTLGTIFISGMMGLYSLVAVSACMSLMFPTIYGIALKGLGEDAKIGSAGLILAIGGGSLMPPLQGAIMDMSSFSMGELMLSSTRVSFCLPVICFLVIGFFGWNTARKLP
ncbi:MAG TPA: L-fucose:H+ symporter permease [Candidatus Marinimicrobia bacterium]|nr:L-fucose:H+ symporter permease [Candidatus Neomarinimicrobiota bacterium]HHZ99196.1 L-fucose:H+ symporter permease [Candidatus Neomarinimicrobiota bacterium]HIB02253.1 L-fucose:H+ symporter permease [Candidatus Neomarinimicrobiota bacterium]HIB71753.1 L-fucose:H+ symporter permease [Candidatus Neomarinimicrobiota bacterium]HIB96312.1 L-fucose:H+ symporter permease [Candidatus Neomarinimicrobiota bacterium]